MLLSKYVASTTTLLCFVTSDAFFVGGLTDHKASLGKSRPLQLQVQRQRAGAIPYMRGGFEMPHQTKKRKKHGFGGGKAKKPPEQGKTLTTGEAVARHMLMEFNTMKAEGGEVERVYARLKDTEEWLPVGNVCTEAGCTAQGTQGQKRLILDHASEMYSQLRSGSGKKLVLEAGFGPEGSEDSGITLCKGVKYNGERVGVALDPLPEGPFFRRVAKGRDVGSTANLPNRYT